MKILSSPFINGVFQTNTNLSIVRCSKQRQ
nr:MAG TPA: protein of unknown function (DUF4183) [Bacteriophage sp.]DAZ72897.1 MAG TPA: protein of unknown function (DUF4183) [Caudoviricetes sp.]